MEACVPTGRKNGVSTTPCGVVRRPERPPEGSVFSTSMEEGTRRVYQLLFAQIAAQTTLASTQTPHSPNTTEYAMPDLIFLGFAAANPITASSMNQIQKRSSELPRAASHFGASSLKNALTFVATMLSGSTSPTLFSGSMIMAKMLCMTEGK